MKITNWFIPIFCLSFIGVNGQDVQKDFKTQSISVFKDGTSFIQKNGTVKTTDGKYKMTKNLPSALFGTFWFHSNDNSVKNVVSYKDEVVTKKQVNPSNFFEVLENNKGEKVKLHIGKDEVVEGTVLFLEEIKLDEDADENEILIAKDRRKGIVTIQHAEGYLSISTREIRRVDFPSNPKISFEKEITEFKPIIEIDLARNAASNQLDMMYLTGGLKWEPTYLLELVNDTKAKLTLRAEVANDMEDIKDTDINFVVGVPNFKYATRLSSLVELFGKMVGINRNAATQFSNATFNPETYEVEKPQAGTTDLFKDATGSSNEDLFFYSLENFSLKKGGRGYFQMFEADIDIKHIYECNLAKNGTHAHHYSSKNNIHQPASQNPTIHSVKIVNNSTFPWTSGAAMVVKKDGVRKPISQDRLFYTPVKGHSFIKLTEAPDIQIAHEEKSINRVDNAKKKHNKNYHLVTVEGKVKIKNYKNKAVDLNVHRTIIGELKKSSKKWLKAPAGSRHTVNDIVNVCWEMNLKAGEEKEIVYSYEVYVSY